MASHKREERRAATLAPCYRRKLAKYDFNGTTGEERGPLAILLELEGLVVGPFGNGSTELHNLHTAESREAARSRAMGWEVSDWELGLVIGESEGPFLWILSGRRLSASSHA